TIKIPFETYTLSNGPTVILSIDHSTPTVAVAPGTTWDRKTKLRVEREFAHLFEHVMFTGSSHVLYGLHDKLTESVGGSNNGTTSNDRTVYFGQCPATISSRRYGSNRILWVTCSTHWILPRVGRIRASGPPTWSGCVRSA